MFEIGKINLHSPGTAIQHTQTGPDAVFGLEMGAQDPGLAGYAESIRSSKGTINQVPDKNPESKK